MLSSADLMIAKRVALPSNDSLEFLGFLIGFEYHKQSLIGWRVGVSKAKDSLLL